MTLIWDSAADVPFLRGPAEWVATWSASVVSGKGRLFLAVRSSVYDVIDFLKCPRKLHGVFEGACGRTPVPAWVRAPWRATCGGSPACRECVALTSLHRHPLGSFVAVKLVRGTSFARGVVWGKAGRRFCVPQSVQHSVCGAYVRYRGPYMLRTSSAMCIFF